MSTYLTGKTRLRSAKRFLREPILVLQVEENYPANEGTTRGTNWRDARVSDLNPVTNGEVR